MHELGVLLHVVSIAEKAARKNSIPRIRHITLEVGEESGFVPAFLTKLFPAAIHNSEIMANCQLKITMMPGSGLVIKDIGY